MSAELWTFATTNPGTTLLIVAVLAWAVTRPFWFAAWAYNRTLRARNIAAHGWPAAPIDADGDVVYPKKEDDE